MKILQFLLFFFNFFERFTSYKNLGYTYDDKNCHLTIHSNEPLKYLNINQQKIPWAKHIPNIRTISVSPNVTELPLSIFENYENLQSITVQQNMKGLIIPKGFTCQDDFKQGYNLNSTINIQREYPKTYPEILPQTTTNKKQIKGIPTNITLYDFYDPDAPRNVTIPSNLYRQYHLDLTGLNNPKVTTSGYIHYNSTTQMINVAYTFSYSISTGKTHRTTEFGRYYAYVSTDKIRYNITVDVVDYEVYFATNVLNDFIAKNITSSMSEYDKLVTITKYVARSTSYCVNYQGWPSMVTYKCGDCWASTNLIVHLCKQVGVKAWARNGKRDPGSGKGHINVIASIKGKYYEAEAGYTGNAPRLYTIKNRTSLFSYYQSSGGIKVYQYDMENAEKVTKSLVIPDTFDGLPVHYLGTRLFESFYVLEKVVLPKSLKTIDEHVFNSCYMLKAIHLPVNVSSIGTFAFTACYNLTSLTVDANNQYFAAKDGVLYNKKLTEAVAAPTAEHIVLPSTVVKIRKYAFYYNKNLKSIIIPSSVKTVLEGAIGTTGLVCVYINGNFPTDVDNYMFGETNELLYININGNAPANPSSNLETLFFNNRRFPTIRVPKGATGYDVSPWKNWKIEYVDSVPLKPEQEPLMVVPVPVKLQLIESSLTGSKIQLKKNSISDGTRTQALPSTEEIKIIQFTNQIINLTSSEKQSSEYYITVPYYVMSYYIDNKASEVNKGEYAILPSSTTLIFLPSCSVPLKLFMNYSKQASNVVLKPTNESNKLAFKSVKLDRGEISIKCPIYINLTSFEEITFYNTNNKLYSNNYHPIEGKSIVAKSGSSTTMSNLIVGQSLLFEYNSSITVNKSIAFEKGSTITFNLSMKHKIKIVEESGTIKKPYLLFNASINSVDNIESINIIRNLDEEAVLICGNTSVFNRDACEKFVSKINNAYCIDSSLNGTRQYCILATDTVPETETPNAKAKSKKTTVIAVSVVVSIVVVAIIIAVVVVVMLKKKKSDDENIYSKTLLV